VVPVIPKLKEWRHQSSHGNFLRVKWTPTGLLVEHEEEGWRLFPDAIGYSVEFPECKHVFLTGRKPPEWWTPNERSE
jgi:hypothetical protein